MAHSHGDVILVPFPFTDQLGAKKRPAVIISSKAYNANRRDLVIMAITSQMRTPLGFTEALKHLSPIGKRQDLSSFLCSNPCSRQSTKASSRVRLAHFRWTTGAPCARRFH